MAWWNQVLTLLRDEFALEDAQSQKAELASAKQAEQLLKQTEREIATAKARAEAARRRLLRAQEQLQELSRQQSYAQHFRDRLLELAKVVSHESDLVETFDAHLQRLNDAQQRIHHQLLKFGRDVQMVRNANAGAAMTETVLAQAKKKTKTGDSQLETDAQDSSPKPEGFRRKHDPKVIAALKRGPKS